MVEIYLIYGLSFVLFGVAALLRPSDSEGLPISRHFWLLGLFGLLHGTEGFYDAWLISTSAMSTRLYWAGSVLLTLSFLPLFEFGRRAVADIGRESAIRWRVLGSPWFYLPSALSILGIVYFVGTPQSLAAGARYFLCFPSAVTAGLTLRHALPRSSKPAQTLSLAFIAYGMFGGLMTEPVAGFPTYQSFVEFTGLPVQLVNAGLAFAAMLSLALLVRRAADGTLAEARSRAAQVQNLASSLEQRIERRTKALAQSERDLNEAQRIAQIGSWELDLVRNVLHWSDEIYRMFEVDPETFAATYEAFLAGIHPDDRDVIEAAYNNSLIDREPYDVTHRLLLPDGRIKWVQERCETEFDVDGKPLMSRGTVQDITELVLASEALSNSEARLRATLEGSLDGVYFHRAIRDDHGDVIDFEFVDVSESGLNMVEYSRSELVGSRLSETFPASFENGLFEKLKTVLETGEALSEEIRALENVGAQWLHHQIVRYGDGVAFTVRDVTEIKLAEQQLHQSQKMEVVGQLTGGIAHDFNNLLAIITGNLDLALMRLRDDPDLSKMLETGIAAAERGAELTNQLLAYSRRQTLLPQATNTNELIEHMITLSRRTLGEAVEVVFEQDKEAWWTHIDAGQLENALLNLAVNARDAMPDGGTVTVRAFNKSIVDAEQGVPEALQAGDYVVIEVEDTGTGMSEEVREKVLEPFFTTKEVGQGSGLGLSMVYGFAMQSAGHVEIDSVLGEGTTVRLYLPRAQPTEESAPRKRDAGADVADRSKTILVVEDNPDVRDLAISLIEGLGYRALQADGASGALDIMSREEPVDLLFTDVVLGKGMNGVELANCVREGRPGFPVLMMSGQVQDAIGRHEGAADAYELISKPFKISELAKSLERLLQQESPLSPNSEEEQANAKGSGGNL